MQLQLQSVAKSKARKGVQEGRVEGAGVGARREDRSSKRGSRSSGEGHMQILSAHVALTRVSPACEFSYCRSRIRRIGAHTLRRHCKFLLINVKNYLILKTLQVNALPRL